MSYKKEESYLIQIRMQYNNIYIKILDNIDTFNETLQLVRMLPTRSFNLNTGEWMIDRCHIAYILHTIGDQIIWMTPLKEIVGNLYVADHIIQTHLSWEAKNEFENFKLDLYPYQKVGSNFLVHRGCAGVFDGCGLGKTPQLIGAFERIFRDQPGSNRGLIVTLNSLKRQWSKEINKFTGKTAIAVTGSGNRREKLIREFIEDDTSQYLIINYETLRTEKLLELIKSIPFQCVGLDEAQKIKNGVTDHKYKIYPSKISVATMQLNYIPYRFVATATPLKGKAEEIWSIFQFINPSVLGNWKEFRDRYCKCHDSYGITGYMNAEELYASIAPYFIRRTKQSPEIQQQLPTAQDVPIFLDMTSKQQELHDYLVDEYVKIKEAGKKMKSGPRQQTYEINNQKLSYDEAEDYYDSISQAYQIFLLIVCDSPELLVMSDSNMAKRILNEIYISDKDMKSPKVDYVVEFYQQMTLDEPDSKVVIFTQFKRMADLIHSKLNNAVIYHGELSEKEKEDNVDAFVNDPHVKCIIATEAGSTGLNLQVANYMIHVDLPWDPTMLEQRNGRIDRTGNKFSNVTIYYAVMHNSYDENLLSILEKKSDLSDSIIDGGAGKIKNIARHIKEDAMKSLLKKRSV